jgi:hypothetical protein
MKVVSRCIGDFQKDVYNDRLKFNELLKGFVIDYKRDKINGRRFLKQRAKRTKLLIYLMVKTNSNIF